MNGQVNSKISIIIPAFNVGCFLKRCLDSVLKQTFTNFEVIVVDDGSKDDTAAIIYSYEQLDPRVIGIFKENGGVTSARTTGVLRAKGEYLFFLDGDDYIPTSALEALYEKAKEQDSDIVFGLFAMERNGKRRIYNVDDFGTVQSIDYLKLLMTGRAPWQLWAKLIKRSLYKIDSIEVPSDLAVGEDALTLFQIVIASQRISMVDQVVYYYVQRDDSVMHLKNIKLANDNLRAADLIIIQIDKSSFGKELTLYTLALRLLFLLMAFQKAGLDIKQDHLQIVLVQYKKYKEVLSLFDFSKRVKIFVIINIYKWL